MPAYFNGLATPLNERAEPADVSQPVDSAAKRGGRGRNRTADTGIFSPLPPSATSADNYIYQVLRTSMEFEGESGGNQCRSAHALKPYYP